MKTIAQVAARRRSVIDYKILVARVQRNIGVEIWRRLALMVRDCMPKLSTEEFLLLHGGDCTEATVPYSEMTGVVRSDFCSSIV